MVKVYTIPTYISIYPRLLSMQVVRYVMLRVVMSVLMF